MCELEIWRTGGNCRAYGVTLPDGRYVLVTDEGGADLPEDTAVDPEGNVIVRDEHFDPCMDSTSRFPVPEGYWRFPGTLVGVYGPEGEAVSLETYPSVEAAREAVRALLRAAMG